MKSDGEITITTKLDNKNFDNDIKEIQNKLEKLREKAEKPYETDGVKVTGGWNLTEEEQKQYDELLGKIEQIEAEKYQLKEVESQITEELKNQNVLTNSQKKVEFIKDEEKAKIEELNQDLESMVKDFDKIQKSKVIDEDDIAEAQRLKEQILQIVKIIEKLTGKKIVIKGINDIEPQTKKIGSGMDNVLKKVTKWGLAIFSVRSAYMFVRQAVSTVSQYNEDIANNIEYIRFAISNTLKPIIEWIIKAVYNILKLIAQIIYFVTGINIFKSSRIDDFNKGLNQANKNIGKMKKQLAGFDEMNILQEDGSTEVGGGGGGLNVTIPDLSEDVEKFGRLNKTIENLTDKFLKLRESIKKALTDPSLFTKAFGNFDLLFYGITEIIDGINDVIFGIVETVGGVLDIIVGIFTLNGDKILDGITYLIQGIGDIIHGLTSIIGGIVDTIGGIIKVGISVIWDTIKWLYNSIISIFSTIGNWFYQNVINPIAGFFSNMWGNIINGANNAWGGVKSVFSTVASFFETTFSNAWGKVKNVFSKGGQIFVGIKDGIVDAFKKIVNALITGINKVVAVPFNTLNGTLNKVRNISIFGSKPFSKLWSQNPIKVPQIPKLAVGGIISQPGRGIPLAYGGEGGVSGSREGVLPLTDSQAMAQLGYEIGRNVVIQLTNITKLDNRQLAREQKTINARNDFTFNR